MSVTIYLASDHRGFKLKGLIFNHLQFSKFKTIDLGPSELNTEDDYPDFAFKLADKVVNDKGSLGILICRNGIGMSVAANKAKGIRAGLCTFAAQAISAKTDDNCNVLVLASDFNNKKEVFEIINNFLKTEFSLKERHKKRLAKIKQYENFYL